MATTIRRAENGGASWKSAGITIAHIGARAASIQRAHFRNLSATQVKRRFPSALRPFHSAALNLVGKGVKT
jgi:hypothetical protein